MGDAALKWQSIARAIGLGFSATDVPKAYGGLDLTLEEQVAICEQLGRVIIARCLMKRGLANM